MRYPWTGRTLLHLHGKTSAITDIPRQESQELARSLPTAQMVSTLDQGKGVHAAHDADSAWLSNVTAIDALRAKKKICQKCNYSTARWTVRFAGGSVLMCEGCRLDGGLLGIVDGGAGDVA